MDLRFKREQDGSPAVLFLYLGYPLCNRREEF